MELLVDIVVGLSDSIIGKKGRKYVSLFGSLFIFILLANLLGLVPGFTPPTSNWWAISAWGSLYSSRIIIGEFERTVSLFQAVCRANVAACTALYCHRGLLAAFRPMSLSIRLYGNMFGDHLVLEIFSSLTKVIIPVVFYISRNSRLGDPGSSFYDP